ncbi:unnamed protein product [Brassica rapa]|uniref:Uncharacterized protein n=2 Tax=Brassica TaxID=3705 RepID=A0A8D9D5Z3_BRACM|nr:unnamed protein product [Brassica napus]CAG7868683.1 unnamed protein product [Brassica rapa]
MIKKVFDIAWGGVAVFASVSADEGQQPDWVAIAFSTKMQILRV